MRKNNVNVTKYITNKNKETIKKWTNEIESLKIKKKIYFQKWQNFQQIFNKSQKYISQTTLHVP